MSDSDNFEEFREEYVEKELARELRSNISGCGRKLSWRVAENNKHITDAGNFTPEQAEGVGVDLAEEMKDVIDNDVINNAIEQAKQNF